MMSLLFRNRWFAAGWVALTLISVSVFAGKDGGADVIAQGAGQIRAQRSALKQDVEAPPIVARSTEPAKPVMPKFEALPGSMADPANPQVGDVFVDPLTGRRMRAVRRSELEAAD